MNIGDVVVFTKKGYRAGRKGDSLYNYKLNPDGLVITVLEENEDDE